MSVQPIYIYNISDFCRVYIQNGKGIQVSFEPKMNVTISTIEHSIDTSELDGCVDIFLNFEEFISIYYYSFYFEKVFEKYFDQLESMRVARMEYIDNLEDFETQQQLIGNIFTQNMLLEQDIGLREQQETKALLLDAKGFNVYKIGSFFEDQIEKYKLLDPFFTEPKTFQLNKMKEMIQDDILDAKNKYTLFKGLVSSHFQ